MRPDWKVHGEAFSVSTFYRKFSATVCLRPAVHSTLAWYFIAKVLTGVQQWCKLIVGDPCLVL